MRTIVVIVAKEPVASRVKTRLCPDLSPVQAAEIYSLFIQDMVEEMSDLFPATLALAYSPEGSMSAFETILPRTIPMFAQHGAGLGERLSHIFTRLHSEGYEQILIINSDSPDMPCSLVRKSTRLLASPGIDLVLGPCADGGYYLIGLKKPAPELFRGIPWSTDRVLALTLERASELGLSCGLLDVWYDIDTCEDLLMFLERGKSRNDGCGPGWRTRKYLRNLPGIHGVT
ncbi:MAG: TIGR04282 family arsenosugar biosynthesis glycosyltransferase [Syntrophobacteraceae bacterium]|nr:TIGR04282 family arsenosugar biosynthesis glycosyltransferase [Syntrophobacteraceae bacterium]